MKFRNSIAVCSRSLFIFCKLSASTFHSLARQPEKKFLNEYVAIKVWITWIWNDNFGGKVANFIAFKRHSMIQFYRITSFEYLKEFARREYFRVLEHMWTQLYHISQAESYDECATKWKENEKSFKSAEDSVKGRREMWNVIKNRKHSLHNSACITYKFKLKLNRFGIRASNFHFSSSLLYHDALIGEQWTRLKFEICLTNIKRRRRWWCRRRKK